MITPAGPAESLPGDRSRRAVVERETTTEGGEMVDPQVEMVDPRVERTSYV